MNVQIKSALHRQQLTRAMKRVILGLGTAPSAPRNMRGRQVSCSSVLLTWQPPERLGHPPFHKYKLQRSEGEDSGWVSVNKNLDDEEISWEDRGLEVSSSCRSVPCQMVVILDTRTSSKAHASLTKG